MYQDRNPSLSPGRVYRTRDLATFGANPTRLARRLVRDGRLRQLRQGLFVAPKLSSWGEVPASDHELMTAFLSGAGFVFTGPEYWNPLGLGATAVSPERLVYNLKRSGTFDLDGRRFRLRRVAAPSKPRPEWYAVDLLENHVLSGTSLSDLETGLVSAVVAGRLDPKRLLEASERYGTQRTRELLDRCLSEAERVR